MKVWIVFLILVFVTPLTLSEVLNYTSAFSGEPSYALEVQTSDNQLNHGDNFTMYLTVSGAGTVNYSKMRVSIPQYIVEDNTVRFRSLNLSSGQQYDEETTKAMFVAYPNKAWFKEFDHRLASRGEVRYSDQKNPIYYNIPYIINFKISQNASSGDHNIELALYYKYKDKWYMDKQAVPIHIKYWYEAKWLQNLAKLALILGIITAIIEILKFIDIKTKLKRWF